MIKTGLKLFLALLLLAIFVLPLSLASPDYVEIGPYNVSFDLGDTEYEIDTVGPFYRENDNGDPYDWYDVFIVPEEGYRIGVYLEDYDRGGGWKAFELYDLWLWDWSPDVIKCEEEKQISVDGKKCMLITFVDIFDETSYLTGWTMESPGPTKDIHDDMYIVGSNFVTIRSWANWDTTRQLLDTIHVVRNEEEEET